MPLTVTPYPGLYNKSLQCKGTELKVKDCIVVTNRTEPNKSPARQSVSVLFDYVSFMSFIFLVVVLKLDSLLPLVPGINLVVPDIDSDK